MAIDDQWLMGGWRLMTTNGGRRPTMIGSRRPTISHWQVATNNRQWQWRRWQRQRRDDEHRELTKVNFYGSKIIFMIVIIACPVIRSWRRQREIVTSGAQVTTNNLATTEDGHQQRAIVIGGRWLMTAEDNHWQLASTNNRDQQPASVTTAMNIVSLLKYFFIVQKNLRETKDFSIWFDLSEKNIIIRKN